MRRNPSTRHSAALRLRRLLAHEWTLAALTCLAVAVLLNRGALEDPQHTLPRDIWDPSLLAYLIAWGGHALRHDPAGLWDLNAFYPAPYGLAYSDAMLGYAPFALVGTGPEAAVLRYNLLYIGAHALVLFGGYALARQLGLRPGAATLVAVALAVPPWRLAQTGHLQVLSTGGIFLALAMLARGHGVRWLPAHRAPLPVRPGWALAGWLTATWQVSIGFGMGVPFLYVLLGCVLTGLTVWIVRHGTSLWAGGELGRAAAWRAALPPRRLLLVDAVGGLVLATVSLLLAQPYLRVLQLYPYARRTVEWVALYSPPPSGLFIAPEESTLWGGAHAAARAELSIPGEMSLLPGFALYLLALIGLVYSAWPRRVRIGLAVAAAAVLVLCLGTNGPMDGKVGYVALLHLPGFEAIRTPGRLIVWATLLLALLAAGALARLGQELPRPHAPQWTRAGIRLALAVPTALVLLEGMGSLVHAPVPPAPPTLSTVPAPYLVLPMHQVMDMNVMLWSTDRFASTVNGGSGVVPTEQQLVRAAVATFPDEASVAYLRDIGVRTVVVLPGRAAGTPWAAAATLPIEGLGLTREVRADAVVFRINP